MTKRISVRVTEEEMARVESLVLASGCRTVSELIRERLGLSGEDAGLENRVKVLEAELRELRELARVG
jgi:Arc/MetJ-type ribon-helix-helix transcriptional regulator